MKPSTALNGGKIISTYLINVTSHHGNGHANILGLMALSHGGEEKTSKESKCVKMKVNFPTSCTFVTCTLVACLTLTIHDLNAKKH